MFLPRQPRLAGPLAPHRPNAAASTTMTSSSTAKRPKRPHIKGSRQQPDPLDPASTKAVSRAVSNSTVGEIRARADHSAKVATVTTYSDQLGRQLCAHVAAGRTLVQACIEARVSYHRALGWLTQGDAGASAYQSFSQRFRRARQGQAESLLDGLLESLDAVTAENYQAARVRCDNLRWLISKLNPARYSDRFEVKLNDGAAPAAMLDGAPEWVQARAATDAPRQQITVIEGAATR